MARSRKRETAGQSLLFADADEPAGTGAYGQTIERQDLLLESFGGRAPEVPMIIAAERAATSTKTLEERLIQEAGGAPPDDFLPPGKIGAAYREIRDRRTPDSDELDRAWTLNHAALAAMTRAIAFIRAGQPATATAVLETASEAIHGKREIRPLIEVDIVQAGDLDPDEELSPDGEVIRCGVTLQFRSEDDVRRFLKGEQRINAMWAWEREGGD